MTSRIYNFVTAQKPGNGSLLHMDSIVHGISCRQANKEIVLVKSGLCYIQKYWIKNFVLLCKSQRIFISLFIAYIVRRSPMPSRLILNGGHTD